jgi:hypothetical protein
MKLKRWELSHGINTNGGHSLGYLPQVCVRFRSKTMMTNKLLTSTTNSSSQDVTYRYRRYKATVVLAIHMTTRESPYKILAE